MQKALQGGLEHQGTVDKVVFFLKWYPNNTDSSHNFSILHVEHLSLFLASYVPRPEHKPTQIANFVLTFLWSL